MESLSDILFLPAMIESRCEASSKSKSAVWYRAADFLREIIDYEKQRDFVIIPFLLTLQLFFEFI